MSEARVNRVLTLDRLMDIARQSAEEPRKLKRMSGSQIKMFTKSVNAYLEEYSKMKHPARQPNKALDVLEAVASEFNFNAEELQSESRKRDLVDARAVFVIIAEHVGVPREFIAKTINRHRASCAHLKSLYLDTLYRYSHIESAVDRINKRLGLV